MADNLVIYLAQKRIYLIILVRNVSNKFTWPGYDIRKLSSGSYSYGVLPEKLIRLIIDSVKHHACNSKLKNVGRDD